MASINDIILAGLGLLTAVIGLIGGATFISRRQKSKNTSKNKIKQSGIGVVNNSVGNVGGTFETSQSADKDKK